MGDIPPSQIEERKKVVADIFDRVSPTYVQVGPPFFARYGRRLVELAQIPEGTSVLDVYATKEEWWATHWSHGARRMIERVESASGPEGLARFKAEVFERLHALTRPDGIHHVMPVLFSVAARPVISQEVHKCGLG